MLLGWAEFRNAGVAHAYFWLTDMPCTNLAAVEGKQGLSSLSIYDDDPMRGAAS